MESRFTRLGRDALFERLGRGHAAGVTVLTPNRRLAQALQSEFAAWQAARGESAWETADILPFGAFVERLWDDALHSDLAAPLPQLLAPVQEQALWEEAIRASGAGEALFSAASAASQCRSAWMLLHGWRLAERLPAHAATEDARAFNEWSRRYERSTREQGLTDAARLPDLVAPLAAHGAFRRPAAVVLFEFDLLAPQQLALLAALEAAGASVVAARARTHESAPSRLEFATPRDELAAAARWARARLEADPRARIGIVVPELAQSRSRVRRALADVLHPDHLVASAPVAMAFNISAACPLDEEPLVHDALALLRLCGREAPFEEASRLLRSPFIAGAEGERAARHRADAALRARAGVAVSLDSLLRLLEAGPRAALLQDRLARLAQHRKAALFGTKGAGDWAKAFSEALRVAGFPGERVLDSAQFQALEKWHEALAAFATLERVTPRMGFAEALKRLARLARETPFQPESGEVPIQALGVLESAGMRFDHLWVTGLSDDAWPMPPRPNPFVPLRLQREAGIPNADPAASLELDRALTQGWFASAPEVVVSHARSKGDSEVAPSPLVAAIPCAALEALEAQAYPTFTDAMLGAGRLERLRDGRAPALADAAWPGGTALFRDQAACPFRAFARHRLQSRPLEAPQPGLDGRDRGTLLHEMLSGVWAVLETRERLAATAAATLEALLEDCAEQAIARVRRHRREALSGRFAQIEKQRLVALARAWLAYELRRADFAVVERETQRPVTFGGLTVNAKLDRMDRLGQGGHAVLDYKTGAAVVSSWLGARPDEPQLPMYALACGEDVRAIAFARVKAGDLEFCGLAREEGLLPGVRTIARNQSPLARGYRDWDDLMAGWRREIEALARGFAAGEASVDPKRGEETCQQCDQQSLCRVAEKLGAESAP